MASQRSNETRQLLIDTGLEMLFEEGVRAGVTHIRVRDVVKRAGLTVGAAYGIWENQLAYHRDLIAAATEWRAMGPATAQTVAAIRPVVESGGSLEDVIRAAAECHVRGVQPSQGDDRQVPMEDMIFSLALRIGTRHDAELRSASRLRHQETAASFIILYEAMARRYSLRMVPPFEVGHLAAVFAALTEGFAVQSMIDIDHPMVEIVEGKESTTWTLLGFCLRHLIEAMTEPVSSD